MKRKYDSRRWQNEWGFGFETPIDAKKAYRMIKSLYWPDGDEYVSLVTDMFLLVATREVAREIKFYLDMDEYKYTLNVPLH